MMNYEQLRYDIAATLCDMAEDSPSQTVCYLNEAEAVIETIRDALLPYSNPRNGNGLTLANVISDILSP